MGPPKCGKTLSVVMMIPWIIPLFNALSDGIPCLPSYTHFLPPFDRDEFSTYSTTTVDLQ